MLARPLLLVCSGWFAALPLLAQPGDISVDDRDAFDYYAPIDPAKSHFPSGTFFTTDPLDAPDAFLQYWYDRQLTALGEPRICDGAGPEVVYRFTLIGTGGDAIAVRLSISAYRAALEWKRTGGSNSYEPGKLTTQGSRQLTPLEEDDFLHALADLDPWAMPTRTMGRGRNGARWLLELKHPGRYHAVDRWAPDKSGAYAKCCMLLLKYADRLSVGPIN